MSRTSTVYAEPTISPDTVAFLIWYAYFTLHVSSTNTSPFKVTALLNDYPNTLVRATSFDNNLTSAAFAITSQDSRYRDILALSVRQLFGNIEITAGYDGSTHVPTDIMAFMSGVYLPLVTL